MAAWIGGRLLVVVVLVVSIACSPLVQMSPLLLGAQAMLLVVAVWRLANLVQL